MSDSTTHTETPWELIPQDGAGHYIARREADGTLRLVAHMLERKHSLEEDLANGRFILIACNSHDALTSLVEELVHNITWSPEDQLTSEEFDDLLERADAALKAAKGAA